MVLGASEKFAAAQVGPVLPGVTHRELERNPIGILGRVPHNTPNIVGPGPTESIFHCSSTTPIPVTLAWDSAP